MADSKNQSTDQPRMPFVMYENGLEMLGRMIESSCVLSLSMVDAMTKANLENIERAVDATQKAESLVNTSRVAATAVVEQATSAANTAIAEGQETAAAIDSAASKKLEEAAAKTDTPKSDLQDAAESRTAARSSGNAASSPRSAPRTGATKSSTSDSPAASKS